MALKLHTKSARALITVCVLSVLALGGCSKEPVELESAKVLTNMDKGSGNFDRVLQICFKKPITSEYYHTVVILTKESVKVSGEGVLRPLASDPDNKCQLKNIYSYIHKDSPIGARQLIEDYVKPGNISQVLIKVYADKPEGKERPISEKVFTDL
ncbi:MAG: hypothetical protein IE937_04835 [Gammaproteobacteria bacterium]|jgi:hypothetical protein|nr:hypothetical protein [Gammaproteobacteria bacterium]MBD3776940.1 hypothetical protein [Thiotrichales bacterium]